MLASGAASWADWEEAYDRIYGALPEAIQVPCPNCGRDALRIAFTGYADERIGFASLWCDHCLFGISISRCHVPEGVEILPFGLSEAERRAVVPNYRIIPPDNDLGDDDESFVG